MEGVSNNFINERGIWDLNNIIIFLASLLILILKILASKMWQKYTYAFMA